MPDWIRIAALVLKISIITQVFAVGLSSTWYDATFLFRHPRLLWNSILARNIIMPAIAIGLIQMFSLHIAVVIAFCVLAVTPVPPLVPKGQLQAGGPSHYIIGLLVSQAVLSIVFVPLTIEVIDWIMGAHAHFGSGRVAKLVFQMILLPLAAGMVLGRLRPAVRSAAAHIQTAGTVLLIAGGLPLLFLAWNALGVIAGNGALLAMAIFVIVATAVGHLLGGPSASDRTVLAEATSSRHPGMAAAIALLNFPEHGALVAGAIVTYLIVRIVLSVPYARMRRSSKDFTPTHSY